MMTTCNNNESYSYQNCIVCGYFFVDRTGVTSQMQEVITKIIENRPEDPIGFLADL